MTTLNHHRPMPAIYRHLTPQSSNVILAVICSAAAGVFLSLFI